MRDSTRGTRIISMGTRRIPRTNRINTISSINIITRSHITPRISISIGALMRRTRATRFEQRYRLSCQLYSR